MTILSILFLSIFQSVGIASDNKMTEIFFPIQDRNFENAYWTFREHRGGKWSNFSLIYKDKFGNELKVDNDDIRELIESIETLDKRCEIVFRQKNIKKLKSCIKTNFSPTASEKAQFRCLNIEEKHNKIIQACRKNRRTG